MTAVAAVIVTYNSSRTIARCVATAAQCFDHVIVVDNASQDGSSGTARAAGASLVIERSSNGGFARATNEGVAAIPSSVGVVTVLNPDVYADKPVVRHLVESLLNRPDVGIIGPSLVGTDGELLPSARPFPTLTGLLGRHTALGRASSRLAVEGSDYVARYSDASQPVAVPWIVGAVMVMRHELFTSLGGFDERYFLYGEDVDLCTRAWRQGEGVYLDPRVSLVHEYQQASRRRFDLTNPATRHHWMSMLRLARTYPREFFLSDPGHVDACGRPLRDHPRGDGSTSRRSRRP